MPLPDAEIDRVIDAGADDGASKSRFDDDAIDRAMGSNPLFKVTTRQGLVQSPEEAARILRVQDRFKMPADFVQRNLGDLEQEMQRVDFDPETFRAESPLVAKWLGEQPEHMAISKDDLPNLARLEALIATSPRYKLTAAGGVSETSADGKLAYVYDSPQAFYRETFRGREVRRELDEAERKRGASDLAETWGPLANVAAGAFNSAGSTLRAVQVGVAEPGKFDPVDRINAASQELSPGIWGDLQRGAGGLLADAPLMVAGGPLAQGVGALTKLGRVRTLLQTAAAVQPLALREGINTAKDSGAWNGLAAWGIETVIPAAFGRTGVERALIPGVTPAVMAKRMSAAKTFLVQSGLEATEEAATEFVHAIHEAASGINPQALDGEQLSRRLIVAGVLGGTASAAFNVPELLAGDGGGPGGDAKGVTLGPIPAILRGMDAKSFMQGLGDVAANSKAQALSPERVSRLVVALGEQGRGTIYVDPAQLTEYAQGKGIDPRAFAQQVVSADDYAEAVATGAPLAIPTATYFKILAGSEHHAAISAMASLSPGDMSVAEAEAQREQVLTPRTAPTPEQQASAKATADAVAGDTEPAAASAQRVQDDVVEQLVAAGFRPADARSQALLYSEGFAALAKRAGKDPFALYEPYRLRITREIPGVVQAGSTDYTDTLLDRLRKGEIPTEAQVRGESLSEYLRRKGGLQDQGAEVSTIVDRDPGRKPGQRSLVQPEGLTLDRAAEAAQELGYIEEATPNALLDALRAEIGGQPVYRAGEGNPETAAIRDGLLELQDYLGRLGVDLKSTDNAAVKSALKAQESAQAAEGSVSMNQMEEGRIGHLSVAAQAFVVSLPAEDRAALEPSIAYLRTHPDPTGDLGNLRMLVDFQRRKAAKAGQAVAYNQPGDSARGRIDIAPDRSMRITLLRNANRSTFLHETGHLYLEVLADLATAPDATPDLQAMWADTLAWLGVEKRSQIGIPQHEQWAEGFETYLMQGKAPSPALRTAFARFKAWLVGVYRRLTDMRVQLSPEIRRTFDRILATDEAIEAAEGRLGVAPTFASAADAGMTAEQFTAYQASVEEAKTAANDQLRRQVMQIFQREATKQWQEEREQVRETTRLEIAARPEYQAIRALRDGVLPNGETVAVKLSKQEIVDTYGSDALWRLPGPAGKRRVNPNNRGRYLTADDGISLQAAAAMFGYRDGQALYESLVNAPDQALLVEQTTDQVMAKAYPDPMLDGSIDEKATMALHNDLSADVLVAELRSLSTRIGQQAAPLELLREHARKAVARQTVRTLRPDRYQVAERTAADRVEKALAKGENRLAFVEKQKQLLNHELYRAAQIALDESESAFERFRVLTGRDARERLGKAGGWEWTVTAADGTTTVVDSEDAARALVATKGGEWERTSSYLDQIDALMERFEFKRISNKAAARRQSLGAWIRQQEEAGQSVAIADALRDSTTVINWKDMTVEQVADLRDAVDHIAHLATFKNRLAAEQRVRDFTEARDGLMLAIATNVKERPATKLSAERSKLDDALARLEGFVAAHRKHSSLAREADGGADGGDWWAALVRPLNEAGNREVTMRQEAAAAVKALLDTWKADGRSLAQQVYVPAIGKSLSRESRLAVALNWGNEGNRDRVLTGEQWQPEQGQAVIDTLDAGDWALVQGVWDHINSHWSEIRALEQRMNGVAPEQVAASPFRAKGAPVPLEARGSAFAAHGVIRGGYYPVAYDPARSPKSAMQAEAGAAALYSLGKATRATTRRGHTKEREGGSGKPLRLDLDVVSQHLSQVIHDLTHREVVRDVNKFLRDDELATSVQDRLGPAALQQMRQTIDAVAVSDLADNEVDRTLRAIRNGVSIATMGFNLTSAAMQITGVGQSMQLVGVRAFAKAAARTAGAQGENAFKLVDSKSEFMRNRATTAVREVNEALNQVKGGAWRDTLNRYAYFLMTQAQRAVDTPTWLAAYENALEANHDESTAVAIADQAVIDTQGSGMVKDLAGVQRSRVLNLFTVYYSYFSATFNRTANATAAFRAAGGFSSPGAIAKLAQDYALLYSMPAALAVLIRGALKGQPEDEEKRDGFGASLLKEHLSVAMGNVILLRDLSGAATESYGYRGPAGAMGFDALSKLIIQAKQGELDRGLVEASAKVVGLFARLPVTQVVRTLEGSGLLGDRVKEPDLRSVLFGPPPTR